MIDDLKLGNVLNDPVRLVIQPRDTLAGLRVLDVAEPVPDETPDIKLVVQNAGAALPVAVNGGRPPVLSRRTCNLFGIKPLGNRTGRLSGRIVFEDSVHDRRFGFIDSTISPDRFTGFSELADNIIAVCIAAAGLARFNAAPQAPPRFVGEVFQVERIHRALEADVKIVHFAFGKREDFHTRKVKALVDTGDIGLIAGEAIKGFRYDDFELTG